MPPPSPPHLRHPRHPRHLLGSAWTRVALDWTYCHWHVVARVDDEVILRATLDPACERRLPWRALRDRAAWLPGWQRRPLPTESSGRRPASHHTDVHRAASRR